MPTFKSKWLCDLCSPICTNCRKMKNEHPTEKCFNFESEGREVTFEVGKEWYQKELHLMRYHLKEILTEASEKNIRPLMKQEEAYA